MTALGFDHVSVLGSTIEEIGVAKCGIFRKNSKFVISDQRAPGAMNIIKTEASNYNNSSMIKSSEKINIPDNITRGLRGAHQHENSVTAIANVRSILSQKLDSELNQAEINGLQNAYWPGRSQKVSHTLSNGRVITVFIDAAHTLGK